MTKEEIAKILRQIGVEDHIPAIIRLYEKALSTQRKDLLEKIEEMKKYSNDGSLLRDNRTYNQALEEVKQLLKEIYDNRRFYQRLYGVRKRRA